jgi:hypothetical protein
MKEGQRKEGNEGRKEEDTTKMGAAKFFFKRLDSK